MNSNVGGDEEYLSLRNLARHVPISGVNESVILLNVDRNSLLRIYN